MTDLGDDFSALREHNRAIKESQRDKRTRLLLELMHEGYDVVQLTPYQYRVNGTLDIYPTWAKWHDIKTGKRGTFRGTNTKEFVKGWFHDNP